MKKTLSSSPDGNNWYRFGDPDSNNDEIEFDPDVDEILEDSYDEDDYE